MGGKAVRAGYHVLVIRYLRGAAQWAARRRRRNPVSRGGVDLAPLSRGKAAAPVGPPFQNKEIGNKRYLLHVYLFRLLCTHTSTPPGEQHRPLGRGEPNPPSDLLGDEAGSSLPPPHVCSSGTNGPGRRGGSRRVFPWWEGHPLSWVRSSLSGFCPARTSVGEGPCEERVGTLPPFGRRYGGPAR